MEKRISIMDKIKEGLSTVQLVITLIIIVAGWVSNYTIMQEKITYLDNEKKRLEQSVCDIQDQIKDYNVLIYKVDKMDNKLNRILISLERNK